MEFGKAFEQQFVGQKKFENRSIEKTLSMGWDLLKLLPKTELDRISKEMMEKYYKE